MYAPSKPGEQPSVEVIGFFHPSRVKSYWEEIQTTNCISEFFLTSLKLVFEFLGMCCEIQIGYLVIKKFS